MAIRNIVQIGDDILTKKSKEVTSFDKRLFDLLDDMRETNLAVGGAGLSAVQVGVLKRAFIVEVLEDKENEVEPFFLEIVNPVLIDSKGEQISEEGCLSIPEIFEYVKRPQEVTVEGYNRHGEKIRVEASGFLAKALCHELDHLDGILFTEKVIPQEQ